MQTFLPCKTFKQTFQCLDWKRLGNQRLEAMILLQAVTKGNGWSNHAAARMWRGYELALTEYMNLCIEEWIYRGYKNTMKIVEIHDSIIYPPWLGDERLHSSHRSQLLFKNPEWYSQFGWMEPPGLPYFWPVSKNGCLIL